MIRMTQDELVGRLISLFGENPMGWAFVCPSCGDVATGRDFREALNAQGRENEAASSLLGQVCIGRILGALQKVGGGKDYKGRGCDWAAFGLFRGPVCYVTEDGKEIWGFEIAPAPDEKKDDES